MSEVIKRLKDRSQKRRQLLVQQFGLSSTDELSLALRSKQESEDLAKKRQAENSKNEPTGARTTGDKSDVFDTSKGLEWVAPEISTPPPPEEDETSLGEEVYKDSKAFLKGTQSANPHNDYCQHYVDTGERPQNFIRDVGLANRFEEYPKLRELIRLKDELISQTNTPPMYLKCDLETFDLRDLECKFDVILIEPPLEEYKRSLGISRDKYWTWDMISKLQIDRISAQRSFVWIWCGANEGLDDSRECLKNWGFRRCEDICWIKTNIGNPGHTKNIENRSVSVRTKEHCLMGIKGTVKRSRDGDFIHANVDIDLIIDEEKPYGSDEKPVEIFHMIEHFCLGRRRLHIFGRDSAIRPGWLSIGPDLTSSNFDAETYSGYFHHSPTGHIMECPEEVERLRPKSPPMKMKGGQDRPRGRGGMSRGGNRGSRGRGQGASNRGGGGRF